MSDYSGDKFVSARLAFSDDKVLKAETPMVIWHTHSWRVMSRARGRGPPPPRPLLAPAHFRPVCHCGLGEPLLSRTAHVLEQIDRTYGHLIPDSEDYLKGMADAFDTTHARSATR